MADDLITTRRWPWLFFEYFFNIATPSPFYWNTTWEEELDDGRIVTHRVNDVLLCIMFFRVYLIVRFILAQTYFMGPRAQRITGMNGCRASMLFSMKCLMKSVPEIVIVTNLFLSVFFFGYALRVFDE